MAYNSAHTGPEIDAAVEMLSQVQDARDATKSDLIEVRSLASQVDDNAIQVAEQAATVATKSEQVSSKATAVELAHAEVMTASASAAEAMDESALSASSALASKDAASASQSAASQSQLAAGLSEQLSAENAASTSADRQAVSEKAQQVALDSASAAESAQSAAAVVTGGTATFASEPGKIPLGNGQGKIDTDWLGDDVARTAAVLAATELAQAAEDAADVATNRTAGFLAPAAAPPVIRDNGLPLQEGDRYFDTETQAEFIYKAGGWAANDSIQAIRDLETGLEDESDPEKGAALIGYEGVRVSDILAYSIVVDDFVSLRSYTGRALSVRVRKDGICGFFEYVSGDSTSPDDGGITIVTVTGRRYRRTGVSVVNPLMFGAVSSTTINSTGAVRSAVAYANSKFLPISFVGITDIVIDDTSDIVVRTSIDWADCRHTLQAGTGSNKQLYTVDEDAGVELRTVTIASQSTLVKGQKRLVFTEILPGGHLYLNSTRELNSRVLSGNVTKVYYRQVFCIDRDGILNEPLEADFTTGAEFSFQFKPFSPRGGVVAKRLVLADAAAKDQGVISCKRSLSEVTDCSIPSDGALADSTITTGIFGLTMCSKSAMRRNYIGGRPATNVAQYCFTLTYVADAVMEDCSGWGLNTWGTILTNYTNGVYFERCRFQRFDAHELLMNWHVYQCQTYGAPIMYGSMYGYLRVKDIVIHDYTSIIHGRSDYGGNCDGDIEVDGVVWRLRGYTGADLSLYLSPIGGNKFTVDLARSITFRNVSIEYDGASPITLIGINAYANNELTAAGIANMGYRKPRTVVIENIRATRQDFVFTLKNVFQFGLAADTPDFTTVWRFSNIASKGYQTTNYFISNNTAKASYQDTSVLGFDKVYVDDCPDVMIQLAKPGVDFYISDVPKLRAVSTWRGASAGGDLYIRNCVVDGTVAIPSMNLDTGELGTGSNVFTMYDTHIKSQCTFLGAKAVQGVTIATGVTAIMPSGASAATLFSGWKSTSFQ